MELAEELVEEVAGSGGITVAVVTPLAVVLAGGLAARGCGECPHPVNVSEPVVLDVAMGNGDRPSGGASDRRGSGAGLTESVNAGLDGWPLKSNRNVSGALGCALPAV